MSAWLGGLLPLAVLLWQMRNTHGLPAPTLISRFSTVAMASVATLALTGVVTATLHVRAFDALLDTTYGRTLMIKVGLFVVLVVLGAINLLVLSPQLRGAGERASETVLPRFDRTVRAELAVGLLVLMATGVLTAARPAGEALDARRSYGFAESARIGDVTMVLRVAPAQAGYNEFGIDITDRRPGTTNTAASVLLRFTAVGGDMGASHDMGVTQVEATTTDGRRYIARGSYLSMQGTWQIEVILRQSGLDDVRHTFNLTVAK
jgi:copper transport protein